MKDNREEARKNREKRESNTEVCRVCGSKDIHTRMYGEATMDCIRYMRKQK